MVERMQRHWREFRESKPWQRFEERYRDWQDELSRITIIYVGYHLLFGEALF